MGHFIFLRGHTQSSNLSPVTKKRSTFRARPWTMGFTSIHGMMHCNSAPFLLRNRGTKKTFSQHTKKEATMPLLPIILWAGVPIVIIGGGYWVGHAAHWF